MLEDDPREDDLICAEAPSKALTPEARLQLAVLEQAVREVNLYGRNRIYSVSRRRLPDLIEWFSSPGEHIFSFSVICLSLGLPETKIRRAILCSFRR